MLRRVGRYHEAFDHYERAVPALHAVGDRAGEAAALQGLARVEWRLDLGATLRVTRRSAEAATTYRAALARAEQVGDRYQQARSLDGLALVCQDDGDRRQAGRLLRRALTTFEELGVPEAEVTRRHLDRVKSPDRSPGRASADSCPAGGYAGAGHADVVRVAGSIRASAALDGSIR